jgi:hypothetical protein
MSVRAYRINKIEHKKYASFNLWNDEGLTEYILDRCGCTLNDGGDGVIDVSVHILRCALEYIKKLEPDVRANLKDDIAWAARNNRDWIQYDCF